MADFVVGMCRLILKKRKNFEENVFEFPILHDAFVEHFEAGSLGKCTLDVGVVGNFALFDQKIQQPFEPFGIVIICRS